ncbi:MAG: DUF362 domain-containing protein [Deltaproteobacteria bacterium]|nr:DUF362 domain-containing protein [Deltaproteobacteria bacterium]
MSTKAKVVVLKTRPETVLDDYRRLLELGEVEKHLDPKSTTILKDNISWHLFFPSSNTTPWQLEGTILGLWSRGYGDLVDVHNKTVVTITDKGERLNKYAPILARYGVPTKYNFKPEDMTWVTYRPKGRMLVLPQIYPEGITLPDYFFGKNIVHLPTVKTHSYTTTTGAMKNAFGGLLNLKRHYTHTWIHDTLVDLLTIQKEIHSGLFAVMDGTTAGAGPGPRTMIPHVKNVILASADQVAIDAVAAKMMGFDPMSLRYIARATELGLGTGRPEEIEIVGETDALNWNWNFEVGVNFATGTGRLLWHSPLKVMQKALFHTPLVKVFIFGSEVFHDQVWYPVWGQKVVDEWLNGTEWGRLWREYPDELGGRFPSLSPGDPARLRPAGGPDLARAG